MSIIPLRADERLEQRPVRFLRKRRPVITRMDEVDDGRIPAGLWQIKPGTALSGFSFDSPLPPSSVHAYLTGYVLIPPAKLEAAAETLL